MHMHICRVNKAITIDINCLTEIEGGGRETINCLWLWVCPPFTGGAWHWRVNTLTLLADYSRNNPASAEVLSLILINSFSEEQPSAQSSSQRSRHDFLLMIREVPADIQFQRHFSLNYLSYECISVVIKHYRCRMFVTDMADAGKKLEKFHPETVPNGFKHEKQACEQSWNLKVAFSTFPLASHEITQDSSLSAISNLSEQFTLYLQQLHFLLRF